MTSPTQQTLYVATSSAGKLRDFALAAEQAAHDGLIAETTSFTLLPLPGLSEISAPAEDANTLEENARAKASYYSLHAPGALVLADDSGLEVDALGGAPGVYSARYAERAGMLGSMASQAGLDAINNQHLLAELNRSLGLLAAMDHRRARYRCVLAAAFNGACVALGQGTLEGQILLAARGTGGFGYDPLFYLPELGSTMAELDPVTRLRLSHRGAALRALLSTLAQPGLLTKLG